MYPYRHSRNLHRWRCLPALALPPAPKSLLVAVAFNYEQVSDAIMNSTSCAVAAAAAAVGASVVYAIMSSRSRITYDSTDSVSDRSPSPSPTASSSTPRHLVHLPLARDNDGGSPWLPVQPPANASPSRHVIKADALVWLKELSVLPGSVVTSLPDIGELKQLSNDQ